jgi:hypothetical protein
VSLPVFWFCRAYALVCLYLVDRCISLVLAVTTVENFRDVLVHLVHLGLGTLQVVWALMFFCVSLLFDASSFAVTCVLGEVDHLCSSLPILPSLGSRQI